MGEEPSGLVLRSTSEGGLSLTKLTKQLPLLWNEQRELLGFQPMHEDDYLPQASSK